MIQYRRNEEGQYFSRSERLFNQDQYWYFKTREGMAIGPFDTQAEALEGAQHFIDFVGQADPVILSRISAHMSAAAA